MTALALSLILIAATIFIHYETLRFASRRARRMGMHPRTRLWVMLISAIFSHLIHVTLYAAGFLLLEFVFKVGSIAGPESTHFEDAMYFSIASYTTLGIGDVFPKGEARLLSGVEALNGLVMVTWTASLTYLHMERFWGMGKDGS